MNGAQLFSQSLADIRGRLSELENGIEKEYDDLERKFDTHLRLENKLKDLQMKQKDKTIFNVGGKLFLFSKDIIVNCDYDNILKDFLMKGGLIDRCPKHFKVILDIFRKHDDYKKGYVTRLYTNKKKIDFIIDYNKITRREFEEELEFYFKPIGCERLFKDFKFYYRDKLVYYKNSDKTTFITHFEVDTYYPNDLLEPYKVNVIEEIQTLDNVMKGIFVDFDSNVIFTFAEEVKINRIQVKPFWGDLDCWYPGDGAGCMVYSSRDKVNWELLSLIPDTYGMDIDEVTTLVFEEREMRYLKFETIDYGLSIAYLKIL